MRASRMTPAQLTAAISREREGRPDVTAMTAEERREAGLMDLRQAAEHEHLASIDYRRPADRIKGPDPDDLWATPEEVGSDAA